MSKFGEELIESLRQAAEHARGAKVRGMRVSKVELPDVKNRIQAQRSTNQVSSRGRIPGFFIAPHEQEKYLRMKAHRRSFATVELSEDKVRAIAKSRMHPSHEYLDRSLADQRESSDPSGRGRTRLRVRAAQGTARSSGPTD